MSFKLPEGCSLGPNPVLFSDMDGTLIGPDKTISAQNKAAIERLVRAGGGFTVATGRTAAITAPFVRDLPLTLPAVVFNGAAVYDFATDCYLHQWTLPNGQGRAILDAGLAVYPEACTQVCRVDSLVLTNPDGLMDTYISEEGQAYRFDRDDNANGCLKVMLWGEHEALAHARAAIEAAGVAVGTRCFFSGPHYLEFLPACASKGAALEWIRDAYDIVPNRIAAIGDYDNDVELLRAAALAACPANAREVARKEAHVQVADHANHAIADLIDTYLLPHMHKFSTSQPVEC